MSVRQVDLISLLISDSSLPWNRLFDGRPVVVPDRGPLPRLELAGGAAITLLSPTMEQLRRLRPQWQRELKKAGLLPGAAEVEVPRAAEEEASSAPDEIERNTEQQAFEAAPEDIGLESLANSPFRADQSIANGSSIALLVEVGDRSLLLGGDAYSLVLEESIRRLLHERGQKRLPLNLFVVPHGGGRGSISRELLELIACDRYVIATSGALFHHPNPETVARIIVYGRAKPGVALTLVFNYRSQVNNVWASPHLQNRYAYQAVYPNDDQSGIRVTL
jgi:hypothetical protein